MWNIYIYVHVHNAKKRKKETSKVSMMSENIWAESNDC